jgi:hypothetical protein
VTWRRPKPAKGKAWPGVLDATRAELVRGIEQRHGPLFHRIARVVIVAGYSLDRALHRVRALRSDGAASLLAMATALLYCADIRSGFIGKPREGGGPWHRYSLADLAQMAYGAQTDAEIRRASRALDMMVSLGWAFPTKMTRDYDEAKGKWVGFPGVRRLNLERLCKATGTDWLLKRDRVHLDATKGNNVVSLRDADRRQQAGYQADQAQTKRAVAARQRFGKSAGVGWRQGQAPPGAKAGPAAFAEIINNILDDEG